MKIGHNPNNPAAAPSVASPAPASDAAKANTATATAIPSTADASAKIALSSGAASLIQGGSSPDFDTEKVARISQAIDDGTFKINAEVIADKLISNAQELLVKK
ncbi:MAG: flagellar biosynthesis anti-sigma factor FlgM [Burkholderiales bacterium]